MSLPRTEASEPIATSDGHLLSSCRLCAYPLELIPVGAGWRVVKRQERRRQSSFELGLRGLTACPRCGQRFGERIESDRLLEFFGR